ncbi:MAG TPA: FtsX-like permease family protein [Acidothermaceae bacterium]
MLDPWRRAPFLLWRRRPVAVVLAAAAGVLAAAAAAGPLFVSSAADATLGQQLRAACQPGAGLHVNGVDSFGGNSSGADPLAQQMFEINGTTRVAAVGDVAHLLPPLRELYTQHLHVSAPGAGLSAAGAYVTLMSKTGSVAHVESTGQNETHDPSPGTVWLADTTAQALHLQVGDSVIFDPAEGQTALSLRVAGVFKDLQRSATPPYWCNDESIIHTEGNSPVFPFALVDPGTAAKVAAVARADLTDLSLWPVDQRNFTIESAPALKDTLDTLSRSVPTVVDDARAAAQAAYLQAHPAATLQESLESRSHEQAATNFHLAADRARFVAQILPSTVIPITIAAIVVSLLLVGGSGSFWFERRRREVDVLIAHGIGPIALGAKAVLEALFPFLVGGIVGWFAGLALVKVVGPSSLVSTQAQAKAAWFALAAIAAGSACLGLVAGWRCRQRERASFARSTAATRLPWELFVFGAAALGIIVLPTIGTAHDVNGGAVARVDPIVFVAPLLGFVGASAAVVRIAMLALRALRRRGDQLGVSSWLAWRRLTGLPGAAALLMVAVALPTAVGVYGATVNASVRRTLHDQDRMLVGADIVVNLAQRTDVPASLKNRATLVLRLDHPNFGGDLVSVIGVDPAGFARDAFWDDAMPGPSMPSLIRQIGDDGPGAPLRAVISGTAPANRSLQLGGDANNPGVKVNVVAAAPNLPGEQGGYPVLFVDLAAMERLDTLGRYEFWIRGDRASALGALAAAGINPTYVYDANTVTDGSYIQPVAYTFSFLNALVSLIGAVAGGALLLYLDARSRARRVGYVLARRMGLSRAAHLTSIAIELGAAMLVGLVAGLLFSVVATAALSSRFSVEPKRAPHTVLSWPWHSVILDVAVLLVVLVVAALAAQRASERTPPAEVLREA